MKINWITNNMWLKFLSLGLAVLSWFYITGEIERVSEQQTSVFYEVAQQQTSGDFKEESGFISKKVVIHPAIKGAPAEGFFVDNRKIKVNPKDCVIIGPKAIMDSIAFLKTEPIDVTGLTRSFVVDTSVEVMKGVKAEGEKFVKVRIYIKKRW